MSALRAFACASSLAAAIAVASSCGSYNEQSRANCAAPAAAAHAVTCPGVTGCICEDPNACCLASIDAYEGTCGDPRTCAGLLLSCDGPEDCNGGVCCLTRSGSSCTPMAACQGTWLCRTDSQCNGSGVNHCTPADFGQPGVQDRGLDGRIGLCRD
jgi:hypothetical protein